MKLTIEDRLDIQKLNATYCWAVDTSDVELYLDQWHKDGVSEAVYGSAKGREELKERFIAMQNGISTGKRHVVTNLIIEVTGDKVLQKCYLTVFDRINKPKVIATAVYSDELIYDSEKWKFLKRTIEIDPSYKF